MTEVKAKCLYINRRWQDLDEGDRRGAGKGQGRGALCSKSRHPTQVPEHLPTQTDMCQKIPAYSPWAIFGS